MARAVYISSTDALTRARSLGVGFLLDTSAKDPYVLIQGGAQDVILPEPTTKSAVNAALAPILAAEQATQDAEATRNANADTLRARAQAALTANATFLALGSPTNAQTLAQVQLLTKECNGIIRLLLGVLDSTSGT